MSHMASDMFRCRSHNSVLLFPLMTHPWTVNKSNRNGTTRGTGTVCGFVLLVERELGGFVLLMERELDGGLCC